MRVAVIGAGMTGLVAARRLALLGHECEVFERWPGLGGQVATLDVGDGILLERYYHHLFTSDVHIAALYDELGMDDAIEWLRSSVAMFAGGRSHPFTTPGDLLRFPPLPLRSRLRMGLAVLLLQRLNHDVSRFERETAAGWIKRRMGREPWDSVWGPLLRGKFGNRAEDISMAWLWSKLNVRRQIKGREARQELLGYPRGGWQPLLDRLRDEIESNGSAVRIDQAAASVETTSGGFAVAAAAPGSFRVGHDPRAFEPSGDASAFDAVLATVPGDIFIKLLGPRLAGMVGDDYLGRVRSIEYHSALCLLLELDRQFTPFYWTNVADRKLPFVGLIEQTNLLAPSDYGNRHLLYVANYLAPGDSLLKFDPDALVERYEAGLKLVNPSFSRGWIRRAWVFREPAAQPIVTVGYGERIPALRTPAAGLFLANTTQIYPEDRGTNYSVRLGEEAARAVANHS